MQQSVVISRTWHLPQVAQSGHIGDTLTIWSVDVPWGIVMKVTRFGPWGSVTVEVVIEAECSGPVWQEAQ